MTLIMGRKTNLSWGFGFYAGERACCSLDRENVNNNSNLHNIRKTTNTNSHENTLEPLICDAKPVGECVVMVVGEEEGGGHRVKGNTNETL